MATTVYVDLVDVIMAGAEIEYPDAKERVQALFEIVEQLRHDGNADSGRLKQRVQNGFELTMQRLNLCPECGAELMAELICREHGKQ